MSPAPRRVSYSLLDPILTTPLKAIYPALGIPRWFPPEGLVAAGHLSAIFGAIGFAYAPQAVWAGVLAALGVAANHAIDVLDGTHARATNQCRNGGELLDHFVDPLSFSYWIIGIAVSCGRLDLGLVGVVTLYATAVLTNIKAKLIGEFTLARFASTEFKALLVLYGLTMAVAVGSGWLAPVTSAAFEEADSSAAGATDFALGFLAIMCAVGVLQLVINLWRAVRDVNVAGAPPDTTEWEAGGGQREP